MGAILLVVGNAAAPTTSDTYLKGVLEGLGHTITLRSDDDADSVSGFDGVVIAESISSATLGSKYNTAPVPLVNHETGNINDLRLATGEGTTEVSGTQIDVSPTGAVHPIFSGPYGTFPSATYTILSGSTGLGYVDESLLASGIKALAHSNAVATRQMVYVCEAGATLASGTAEGRRACIFPVNAAAPGITADGESMLKNAYTWAFSGPSGHRRLVGPRHLGASAETLYAVPSGRRTRMRNILVNNPTGSPVAATLSVGPDAASTRLLDAEPIAAGGAYRTRRKADYTLEAGEVIQGFASSGSALVIIIDGVEYAVT